jgi:hypothetical protein
MIQRITRFSAFNLTLLASGRLIQRARGIKSTTPCSSDEQQVALTVLIKKKIMEPSLTR